ncbi:MAG TPA: hypothetical protein VE404_05925 [Verrucomicrobiae bacterium]|nr:hypothetical protein [Verrucomicrobiae bacterium]
MDLEYVPLLKTQRELYGVPRGMERFRAYLRAMALDIEDLDCTRQNLAPRLAAANRATARDG